MKKQCYIICKDKKNSNVTLINYEKMVLILNL